MLSGAAIRSISDVAAYRAAQEDRQPLLIWNPERDARGIPFLGPYVPAGWREEGDPIMVDKTGWGAEDEPALTWEGFTAHLKAHPGLGWAIVEEGQFQVMVQAYAEDPEAPGSEPPEPDPCEYCGAIHNDLEECEPCWACDHDVFAHGIDAEGPCEECDCEGVVKREEEA